MTNQAHAEQLLQDNKLAETLASLTELVREDPSNPKHRVFLFQLLAVMGDWSRALNQLNVSGELDPNALLMVQTYREALQCEMFREQVFSGAKTPLLFDQPEEWVALMLEALRLLANKEYSKSQQIRSKAFDAAPVTSGTIDGEEFNWIADADQRLGPTLEAIINGRYYWVPFNKISKLIIDEPSDLRDLVWVSGQITWPNGGEVVALIPSRYPNSYASDDPLVCLSKKTEWLEYDADVFVCEGQRMLTTDKSEYSLLNVREIECHSSGDEVNNG